MPPPAFHHLIAINPPAPRASRPKRFRTAIGMALVKLGTAVAPSAPPSIQAG